MFKRMRFGFWAIFLLLVFYMGVSVYFMEHFFPGTTVNGKNVDFLTTKQVMAQVLEEAQNYELTLQAEGVEPVTLSLEEMGASFCENDAVRHIKRIQNGFLWPRLFVQKDSYHVTPGVQF